MKLKFLLFSFIFLFTNRCYNLSTISHLPPNDLVPVNRVSFNFYGTKDINDLGCCFRFFMTPDVYNYFNLILRGYSLQERTNDFIEKLMIDKNKIKNLQVQKKWGKVIDDFQNRVIPIFHSKYPTVPITNLMELEFDNDNFYNYFCRLFWGILPEEDNWRLNLDNLEKLLRQKGAMLSLYLKKMKTKSWRIQVDNSNILPQENAYYVSEWPHLVEKYEPLSFYYFNWTKKGRFPPALIIPYDKEGWNIGQHKGDIYDLINKDLRIPTEWMRGMNHTNNDYLVYLDPGSFVKNIYPDDFVSIYLFFCSSHYFGFKVLNQFLISLKMTSSNANS